MISFYTAGKTWQAVKFAMLRDIMGYPVKARWIDLNQESELVLNRKDILWEWCFEDVRDSNFVLLFSEQEDEEQRGALVEVGMAFGLNKPVYAINKCKSLKANDISDVAFTHFHLWNWVPETSLQKGAAWATAHYMKTYMRKVA
jgi:nucleoside 2-deoxyribosyltransferase